SVADDPRLPVVAAVGVGRGVSIDHQDPNPPFGEKIACRHPDGSGTDDDHVIAFCHVGPPFRVKNPAKGLNLGPCAGARRWSGRREGESGLQLSLENRYIPPKMLQSSSRSAPERETRKGLSPRDSRTLATGPSPIGAQNSRLPPESCSSRQTAFKILSTYS